MSFGNVDPMMFALFLGGLALIPILLMITTAFLKIAMVLIIARNAIGVQQVPPNMAVYGIALAATLFVMAPVFKDMSAQIKEQAIDLSSFEKVQESLTTVAEPLTEFMSTNTHTGISDRFIANAKKLWPEEMKADALADNPLIAIPAFVISEMQAGFEIGFLIYIPFIVIDLIVSNILLALGMQMVAPMTVSLPLKILLFVMVDGWTRLLDGLIFSYI